MFLNTNISNINIFSKVLSITLMLKSVISSDLDAAGNTYLT